jgi:hypothetical protein
VLSSARVLTGEVSRGVELPHRSIQEYFGAVAVLAALQKRARTSGVATPHSARSDYDRRQQSARDLQICLSARELYLNWKTTKRSRVPRDAALAVLLCSFPTASEELAGWQYDLLAWALNVLGSPKQPAEFSDMNLSAVRAVLKPPFERVTIDAEIIRAMSAPANDSLRHCALVLCGADAASAALGTSVVAAFSGCEVSAFCEYLGSCIRVLPPAVATVLDCRGSFERATLRFWEQGPFIQVAQTLGPAFWAIADAVTGGAQAERAFSVLTESVAQGCELDDSKIARACAAVAVLGALTRFTSHDHLIKAHSLLQGAISSSIPDLAAEAVFAQAVLETLPSSVGSDTTPLDLRQRLLGLAQPRIPSANLDTVRRATDELARRFIGDADVHAALKAAVQRSPLPPFARACMQGPGIALISPEIAYLLFESLGGSAQEECTRLAMRLWNPAADASEIDVAVANQLTPLHIAADRSRADFVSVFCGYADVDADAQEAVNARSKGGQTPLDLASGSLECIAMLLQSGAVVGRTVGAKSTPLHTAAAAGDTRVVRQLIKAEARVDALDEVCCIWCRCTGIARNFCCADCVSALIRCCCGSARVSAEEKHAVA